MDSKFLGMRSPLEECPKCGKHSLAQCGSNQYHCLWCGFYRDVSVPEGRGLLIVLAIFGLLLIVLFGTQTSDSINPVRERLPNSRSPGLLQEVKGDLSSH